MQLRRFILLAALFATLAPVLTSCHKEDRKEARSILIYLAGNNNISYYAEDDLEQLESGYLPPECSTQDGVFVYLHTQHYRPQLLRLARDGNGDVVRTVMAYYDEKQNSASAATLKQVILDVERLWPAERRGLVLWSHATGYLPRGYFNDPKETGGRRISDEADPFRHLVKSDGDTLTRTFGVDYNGDDEMELADLAAAIPHHYEYICFDCCLMGGIEVAYECRNVCDYVVFSPTEILVQGFPYYMMMEVLFSDDDIRNSLISVAREYYDYYAAQGGTKGCTISVIQTDRLPALAAACAPIFERHRAEILAIDGNTIQQYFRMNRHWFYDLGDIVKRVADADEYTRFAQAMDGAVIYKAATPYFLSIVIDPQKYSGLSSYLPNPGYHYLNEYYKGLLWNIDTGFVK